MAKDQINKQQGSAPATVTPRRWSLRCGDLSAPFWSSETPPVEAFEREAHFDLPHTILALNHHTSGLKTELLRPPGGGALGLPYVRRHRLKGAKLPGKGKHRWAQPYAPVQYLKDLAGYAERLHTLIVETE